MSNNLDYCHEWLSIHNVEVVGVTQETEGFCVVEEYSNPSGGYYYTVWVPAKLSFLRDWMGY